MLRTKNALKLVVIDRDGTLNTYREGYIKSPEEFEAIPGSLEAVALLNRAGWHVVVASNQPGLGRGVMDMAALNAIHTVMHQQLAAAGARVDAVFFCPHSADDGCDCHKPLPGLLLQIAERYGVELASIHVVGDALRDLQAATQAGWSWQADVSYRREQTSAGPSKTLVRNGMPVGAALQPRFVQRHWGGTARVTYRF